MLQDTGKQDSFERVEEELQRQCLPERSKRQYENEWATFVAFVGASLPDVNQMKRYLLKMHEKGFTPPTIWRSWSILKKCSVAKGINIENSDAATITCWLKNISRSHIPRKTGAFELSDLEKWANSTLKKHEKETIKVAMIGIAFFGGLRVQENYNLQWEDVDINEKKREVMVNLQKCKTTVVPRQFIIPNGPFYEGISAYRNIFLRNCLPLNGNFYRSYNCRYDKFSKQRRGLKSFNKLHEK